MQFHTVWAVRARQPQVWALRYCVAEMMVVIRERLYFNAEGRYAGIMIYTADADSEGSLGGLVRQGRLTRGSLPAHAGNR